MIDDRARLIALMGDMPRGHADAAVLLEGDGTARIDRACHLVRSGEADCLLFSGGLSNPESGAFDFERCLPRILDHGIPKASVLVEDRSKNTVEQARNVLEMARERRWKSLTLVASSYHQYRAFLTFLAEMRRTQMERSFDVYNAPAVGAPWMESTPWGRRIDLLEGEFEKIDLYRAKGDVADWRDGWEYCLWQLSR